MKKRIIALIVCGMAILSGCGESKSLELNIKFERTKEQVPEQAKLDEIISEVFGDLGINEYTFYNAGNFHKVVGKSFDFIYETDRNPVVASCVYYDMSLGDVEKGWYVRNVRDCMNEKCFYLGDKDKGEFDLYDYKTVELISKREKKSDSFQVTEQDLIKSTARIQASGYEKTTVTGITVNDDLGKGSGYILLVDLKWNVQNSASTAEKVLKLYSDDLAAVIAKKHSSVNEISLFWNTPYLTDKTSKFSYTCKNGGAYSSDTVISF